MDEPTVTVNAYWLLGIKPPHWRDLACVWCVPDSTMLTLGWACAFHRAENAIAESVQEPSGVKNG